MKLAEVAAYVLEKTGVKRSRATVYLWVTKGIGPDHRKLQTEMKAGQIFTKAEWVDEFIAILNQR
jgi:hypothetical protein